MEKGYRPSKVLGAAFIFQFVTSLASGTVVQGLWRVPGDIVQSMINIANAPQIMRGHILLDVFTALGIIFLGAMLFVTLKREDEKIALIALGFYIVEAVLLAVSKGDAFSFLRISREYAASGNPEHLEQLAGFALESMDFLGVTLHMVVFCLGGMLFYYLFFRSRTVPTVFALWGLISLSIVTGATFFELFGVNVPMVVYFPYVPFELVIGIWIVIKGEKGKSKVKKRIS